MEGFERVRAMADDLNETVVAAGTNPFDPRALAVNAAEHRQLEAIFLPPGDPALKGAKAVLDEQSGTIFCEDTGSAIDQALLLAHEIGHDVVHAGASACGTIDFDPSRSTEAAPVGLQRVEDYGARERRELQADVFAREFVLPRTIAKRLHVDEGLSASSIAARTGLPITLVRQQLFDAVLLPLSPVRTTAPAAPTRRQDPSQDSAAVHRGTPFQLQAGPGTGKTRTLIQRVLSLLAEGIDAASILVLTFSNRAAGELAERLTAAVADEAMRIWIGTIHAFGLDLVRRHHDRLGLPANPVLFDRSDAIEVLEERLPILPLVHYRNLWDPVIVLRDVLAAISRAKDEVVGPAQYRALAQAMMDKAESEDDRVAAAKCLEIAAIYDAYDAALRENGAVDFGDLIMRPTLLLESEPAPAKVTRLRHRHVLVDEYQDVNRASARLLKAVAGDGKGLWVVGDVRQSIYRFRGASSVNVAQFGQDFPGACSAQLGVNYRSTDQIAAAFAEVARRTGASSGMLPLETSADRGQGPEPQIRRCETPDDEAAGLAASVCELRDQGLAYRDQAVLCRSNASLNELAAALEVRGIPVLHLGSLFEREEVRDLLALMSLAADRLGEALVRVASFSRYDVSLQDVYAALGELERPAFEGLDGLAEADEVSAEGAAALARLAEDLRGLNRGASGWEFLSTYLLDRTDIVRDMGRETTVSGRMRGVAVWQFLNFVRGQSVTKQGLHIRRTLERVRQLVLLAEERDLRQVPGAALDMDAVRLMTVHGSKGLEFEAVHLPGMTVSSFPSSYRGERCPPPDGLIEGLGDGLVKEELKLSHEHEEECLFFVAVSRARTHLRLYSARKQRNGNRRAESKFVGWLDVGLLEEIKEPAMASLPPDAAKTEPLQIVRWTDWSPTDTAFGVYDKCPRRFFYTHVLGLGAARKQTAFTKTHDCLYVLMDWLRKARSDRIPTVAEAEAAFEEIWQAHGPVQHAFSDDYRSLASRLIGVLVREGAGLRFRETRPLPIDLPSGRVVVEPNEILELPSGAVGLRRVRTGQPRRDEYDKLEYALYRLAADAHFGSSAEVLALHLTDGSAESVPMTAKKLTTRRSRSDRMLRGIAEGLFPPRPDSVMCARCPHFFICPSLPQGSLTLP